MVKNNQGATTFLESYAIFLTICMISSVTSLIGVDFYAFVIRLSILLFFVIAFPFIKKDINLIGLLYCGAITVGFVFHRLQGLDVKLFTEVLIRIVPILIILHYKQESSPRNRKIRLFALSFFILECTIAIYEKLTLTHLIDYDSDSQAMNADMYFSEEFRSFSLLGHPLCNANVVSILLAFILCSQTINKKLKFVLVLLGLGAIWSFNSRACMMMWLILLFYRFFLYGKSLKWVLISIGLLFIVFPSVLLYVQKTGALGRLDFDFSDGSTMTRIMAIEIFLSHSWSLSEMLMGGVMLEQPVLSKAVGVADFVYIENGYLLDLGYWGFFLGPIKILGEMIISYQALRFFHVKDKIIIMIALWGVAVMNNNTFSTFLMPFYMCSFLAFGATQKIMGVKESGLLYNSNFQDKR